MFDVQFTCSQGAFCYQDTNSLRKLALTKRKKQKLLGRDNKTHLVDKIVMSNSVEVFLA